MEEARCSGLSIDLRELNLTEGLAWRVGGGAEFVVALDCHLATDSQYFSFSLSNFSSYFFWWFFAVSANVAALVAARALTAFDVVVELTLCLRGNFLAFYNGIKVGPFKTGRELVGLFVGWAACEMGFGRVFNLVSFLPVLLRGGLMACVFGLIPFLFGYLGFSGIHNIGDGGLDTAEMGWIGAVIDGSFDSF
jgi:hypothetical protein